MNVVFWKIKEDPAAINVEIINTNATEKLPGIAVNFNLICNKHLGGNRKTIICYANAHWEYFISLNMQTPCTDEVNLYFAIQILSSYIYLCMNVYMYVWKYFTWFTETNIFFLCNLSAPIYSIGPMTGFENIHQHILGVLSTSFMKGTMDPTSMGFSVLCLRLITIVFWEKDSY